MQSARCHPGGTPDMVARSRTVTQYARNPDRFRRTIAQEDPGMRAPIDLCIKRVYAEASPEDGMRVLVDRLWPRGMKKADAQLSLWLKDIAPTTALRRWFHEDKTLSNWDEFRHRYRAELDQNPEAVARLRDCLRQGRVTLLYAVQDETHNHAAVLADYLRAAPL